MRLKKLKLSKKGKLIFFSSLFIIIISAFGLYYLIFSPDFLTLFKLKQNNDHQEIVENIEDLEIIDDLTNYSSRWLDGKKVEASMADSFPVAIMIDNDPLARPQAGLAQALLVYEAPVEGRITRYLAVYLADMELDKVGPVRSARPYFVQLASELKAAYLHVGGSPEAIELIKKSEIYDLNEFYNEKYFWRDYNFPAPHHIFTNQENWLRYLNNRGLVERQTDIWQFKEEFGSGIEQKDIDIVFGPAFQVRWEYNLIDNDYLRILNDQKNISEGTEIRAKNIIIQKVRSEVLDNVGRLKIETSGEGEAIICLDGSCRGAKWRKRGANRTKFYDDDNDEIQFNPGITWVELADDNTMINY